MKLFIPRNKQTKQNYHGTLHEESIFKLIIFSSNWRPILITHRIHQSKFRKLCCCNKSKMQYHTSLIFTEENQLYAFQMKLIRNVKYKIPAMILIEVIELIIDKNRTFHLLWNLKYNQRTHIFRCRQILPLPKLLGS